MNYKRKRPKERIIGTPYWDDVFYSSGNHRFRVSIKDLRKPQFYHENHANKTWRYHDQFKDY